MKKFPITLALIIAGCMALPTLSSAQEAREGGRRGAQNPEAQLKMMKETLTLTDEQTEKVKAALAKNQEKQKALRDNKDLSQEDRRAKMREIYQGMEEDLKPILTPEQMTKWKEEREKRRAERANRQ
jgi:periplasmic protein CpxP/Spy